MRRLSVVAMAIFHCYSVALKDKINLFDLLPWPSPFQAVASAVAKSRVSSVLAVGIVPSWPWDPRASSEQKQQGVFDSESWRANAEGGDDEESGDEDESAEENGGCGRR